MKSKAAIVFLALLLLFTVSNEVMAQQRRGRNVSRVAQRDSTAMVEADSLALARDSLGAAPVDTVAAARKTQLEAPVTYEANDSISFTQGGYAHLYGGGKINYQQIELAADIISMNMDSSTVFARGAVDTLGTS